MKNSVITVNDALKSRYLSDISKVRAGRNGLNKKISWVHIFEIRDVIKESIDSYGMILTTGIGFTDKTVAIDFVKALIEKHASALCIETALYYNEIDEEIIRLADDNDFVLIEIPVISRFIDISKGINTMILSAESKIYDKADKYDSKMSELETEGTLADGIKYTAQYLNVDIAYIPDRGSTIFSSKTAEKQYKGELNSFLNLTSKKGFYQKGKMAVKRLQLYDLNVGYIIFRSTDRDINHFDTIILERLSNRLVFEVKKELAKREDEIYNDSKWIIDWMKGLLNEGQVTRRLKNLKIGFTPKEMFALAIKAYSDAVDFHNVYIHNMMVVRPCFEAMGMYILGIFENDILWNVVLSRNNSKDTIENTRAALEKICASKNESINYDKAIFAMGRIGVSFNEIHKSYETAAQLLEKRPAEKCEILIYDTMNINRIMNDIKTEILEDFVNDILMGLTEEKNLELLWTLKVYFDYGCNKQKASEKLHIVRQTLYFRLGKIEDILGVGYEDGEEKFSIEFAIKAYEYIHGSIFQKTTEIQKNCL